MVLQATRQYALTETLTIAFATEIVRLSCLNTRICHLVPAKA